MDFALDDVLLLTFWRFWACGHFDGEKKNGNRSWVWGS